MLEFIFIGIIILDIVAIVLVVNEELFYTPIEKFYNILFIIFVPILGTLIVLFKLNCYVGKDKKLDSTRDNSPDIIDI